jgi:hypothetical protein
MIQPSRKVDYSRTNGCAKPCSGSGFIRTLFERSYFYVKQEELDPDVEAWLAAQTKETSSYEATRCFQESWPAKLPWAEYVKGEDGLYDFVRCLICSEFEHKDKILKPKFDTLKKHGGKRKAKKAIPSKGIRARQW